MVKPAAPKNLKRRVYFSKNVDYNTILKRILQKYTIRFWNVLKAAQNIAKWAAVVNTIMNCHVS